MNKQAGTTLVGFIIGLVLGLGIALAVAVYVTKVPIPLVDRGVTREPGHDAIEAERNKGWNPNAGLSSKPPPAPVPTTSEAPAQPTASAAPPAAAPAAAKPDGKTDPLGDLIQSRNSTAPTPAADAPPAADPYQYFVQAGAFRSTEEAEAQRARLAMLGFDAKVSEREQAGRSVFRVRIGPFDKKADADHQQERLNGQNVDTALVRVQR